MVSNEYHGLEVIHPMWALAAVKAARQGHAIQLPKPVGCDGKLYVNYGVLADGSVRWKLVFADKATGKQTQVAKWLTDWLPDERITRERKPIVPPAEPIRITSGGCDYYARVVLDHLGLPWPEPVRAIA